eukprot:scaffold20339_cov120-Isochrysis_galbana.AAC.1
MRVHGGWMTGTARTGRAMRYGYARPRKGKAKRVPGARGAWRGLPACRRAPGARRVRGAGSPDSPRSRVKHLDRVVSMRRGEARAVGGKGEGDGRPGPAQLAVSGRQPARRHPPAHGPAQHFSVGAHGALAGAGLARLEERANGSVRHPSHLARPLVVARQHAARRRVAHRRRGLITVASENSPA